MIDKSSPIPVYYQLKNDLISKISQGVWKPGECIASERELCERYDELYRDNKANGKKFKIRGC